MFNNSQLLSKKMVLTQKYKNILKHANLIHNYAFYLIRYSSIPRVALEKLTPIL